MISITLSSSKCPIKILWYLSFSFAAPAMMRTLLLATILSAAKQVTSSATVANSATFKRWCPCYQIIILFVNSVLNRVFVARETWNPGVRDVSAKEVPQKNALSDNILGDPLWQLLHQCWRPVQLFRLQRDVQGVQVEQDSPL